MANLDDFNQFNGKRLRNSKSEHPLATYLVINGTKCFIPDNTTYTNLWDDDGRGIEDNVRLDDIPSANDISEGAVLARIEGTSATYLITNQQRLFIPSGDVFSAYSFDSEKVNDVARIIIESIPSGDDLKGPF